MLPGSTGTRKARDRGGKIDGRTVEIQRLIGRSLRAVVDLAKLGEYTLWIDCDVLEADGGTRTASINGALVAAAGCRLVGAQGYFHRQGHRARQRGRDQRRYLQWRAGTGSRLRRGQGRRRGHEPRHDRPRAFRRGAGGTGEEATFTRGHWLDALLKLERLWASSKSPASRKRHSARIGLWTNPFFLLKSALHLKRFQVVGRTFLSAVWHGRQECLPHGNQPSWGRHSCLPGCRWQTRMSAS